MWFGVVSIILFLYIAHKLNNRLKTWLMQFLPSSYYRSRCTLYGGVFKKDIIPTYEIRAEIQDENVYGWTLDGFGIKGLVDWNNINVQEASGHFNCKHVYEAIAKRPWLFNLQKVDRIVLYSDTLTSLVVRLNKREEGLDLYVDMYRIDSDVRDIVQNFGYLVALVTSILVYW